MYEKWRICILAKKNWKNNFKASRLFFLFLIFQKHSPIQILFLNQRNSRKMMKNLWQC